MGGDDTVGQRKEYFSDFADGFVAHGSENEHQRAFFVGGREGGAQGPGSGGIVGDIEDDLRVLGRSGQDLKAAGPAGFADATLDGGCGDRGESLVREFFRGGNGKRDIAQLVADQRCLDRDFPSH